MQHVRNREEKTRCLGWEQQCAVVWVHAAGRGCAEALGTVGTKTRVRGKFAQTRYLGGPAGICEKHPSGIGTRILASVCTMWSRLSAQGPEKTAVSMRYRPNMTLHLGWMHRHGCICTGKTGTHSLACKNERLEILEPYFKMESSQVGMVPTYLCK